MQEAAALVPEGAVLMIGSFMGVGTPERLVDELARQGRFTVMANDMARPGVGIGIGIGKLIGERRCARVIVSHIATNAETQRQMIAGELEVKPVPQGTLAERVLRPDADRDRHPGGRSEADR